MEPDEIKGQVDYVFERIRHVQGAAQSAASLINRGIGGREISLCITKLQEAEDWIKRAQVLLHEAMAEV